VTSRSAPVNQCSKPTGWFGRFTLWRMNSGHSKLTDWGLEHISIENHHTVLDAGCGGGRTVSKLAAIATGDSRSLISVQRNQFYLYRNREFVIRAADFYFTGLAIVGELFA
jgi:cyclopropane fatty-acyl-phospholipid synthase-like methyltransferase